MEDHREVVDAERPEGVLVLADLTEVLPVAIDVEDVPELARADQLLKPRDSGVVEQEMARHQHALLRLGGRDELLDLAGGQRRRALGPGMPSRLPGAAGPLRIG